MKVRGVAAAAATMCALFSGCTSSVVTAPRGRSSATATPKGSFAGSTSIGAPPVSMPGTATVVDEEPLPVPLPRAEPADEPAVTWTFEPPPFFAPLFDETKTVVFQVADDLDPQGDEGRLQTIGRNSCYMSQRASLPGAVAACFTCTTTHHDDDAGVPMSIPCFVATPAGLWQTSSVPSDGLELVTITRSPPTVPVSLEAYNRTTTTTDATGTETSTLRGKATTRNGKRAYCFTEHTDVAFGVGPIDDEWCIADGLGLYRRTMKNVEGPRTTKATLLRKEKRRLPGDDE